jgi:hypothetical protein
MRSDPTRWAAALGLLVLAGCSRESHKVVAGLHSAGAPVYLTTREGERTIAVGSKLRANDHVRAKGPAVIEYFGGGLHFLEGDGLDVGEAVEAGSHGETVPSRKLTGITLEKLGQTQRLIASRYADPTFTPESTRASKEPTQGEYLAAFFLPDGMEKLTSQPRPEGPTRPLPPPPLRRRIPRLHAGPLGQGGLTLEVESGHVAAEGSDLATAILREGMRFDLGRTTRLVLFPGARARLFRPDGQSVRLKGPLDVRL